MLILLPFHLILTSGPILLAKNHQKVVFSLWMLGVLGVCSIRIFAENMGDPYYEPTIVVHDTGISNNSIDHCRGKVSAQVHCGRPNYS